MIDSKNNDKKINICCCNSSKCFINKGLYLIENININNNNKILHKYRCCKLCKLKFINRCEIKKNTSENKDKGKKTDLVNKMESKSKDIKKYKTSSSEKKEGIVEDLRKKGIISKDFWNSSTKISKVDRYKTEEIPITKQNARKVKTLLNLPSAKCSIIKKETVSKTNGEPVVKKIKSKDKTKSENDNKETIMEDDNIKEPIYISYSLKGFIKIKSSKDIVMCDKYYIDSRDTSDELCYDCSYCEREGIEEEKCSCYYECCNQTENDFFVKSKVEELKGCGNRCSCNEQ